MPPHAPEPEVLLSVVVPVLHEAQGIAELAGHVRALAAGLPDGAVELVVADGAPEGDTLAALGTLMAGAAWRAGTGPSGKDVSVAGLPVRTVAAPRGRARQMNAGAAVARGRVLLFLHADTRLPDGAFPAVLRALGAEGHGDGNDSIPRAEAFVPRAGAFALGIDAPGAWFRVVEALGNLRNRLVRTPYGDQAQFFRAGLFRAMGGYPDLPLMEDVEIMRRLRGAGEPLALLDLRAVTSARRWRDEGAVRCTLRNVCLRLLYALGVPAQRLARWYRARKGAS
ncbi:TIGR04283 family arsenosugar biosynthesis glycosyltransferase [Nitratidesulfovibrio sp. 1201_IL3209]|uniref:TIGR04283 family arsenosugar biosynthesis glycosyltransferase n=1 Tax=Nitratidesulfovibrio sp. 1201_IL3209 TaxID=3084053 RepID=UPI003FA60C11